MAVKDPDFWGFDPSLKEDPRTPEQWLESAKSEHQEFSKALRSEGIEVLYLTDLLSKNPDGCRTYIKGEFVRVDPIIGRFDAEVQHAIREAQEDMIASPVSGLLMGLESGKLFGKLPYSSRRGVYGRLKTLMPQTSLYFTQDPVLSSPNGLIKGRMAMIIRKQEPDVHELALGNENYIHRLSNRTEGGDATMFSGGSGGDVLYLNKRMLLGISALGGEGIEIEAEKILEKAGIQELVKFYAPDFFDPRKRYATGNVMHLDTIMMPVDSGTILANKRMLELTAARDGEMPLVNAYEWATRNNKLRLVEVPDEEQQRTYGWGSNVLPIGYGRIISSAHLKQTNRNLRKAGFKVYEIPSTTLTSGFGSFHCMTAYLG
ncbi:MAG: hypothetical protein HY051_00985 [Candidatus Aenigmarchaeota archaeon]|nr:hypothetical protein [Candidatus Aenigmarchaeota archaeon]